MKREFYPRWRFAIWVLFLTPNHPWCPSSTILCQHAISISKTISLIRNNPTQEACAAAVRAMILSRLDYANSLLLGAPEGMLDRLQIVQNNAARVIHRKTGVIIWLLSWGNYTGCPSDEGSKTNWWHSYKALNCKAGSQCHQKNGRVAPPPPPPPTDDTLDFLKEWHLGIILSPGVHLYLYV